MSKRSFPGEPPIRVNPGRNLARANANKDGQFGPHRGGLGEKRRGKDEYNRISALREKQL